MGVDFCLNFRSTYDDISISVLHLSTENQPMTSSIVLPGSILLPHFRNDFEEKNHNFCRP